MREPQIGVGAHALWRGVNETIAAAARLAGEEPETVLLKDRPILLCVAGWAVAAALILGLT